GRRSGREYRTPVKVFRRGDSYVVSLPYGSDSDWVKNVLAAGGCDLVTRGRRLQLVNPTVYVDEEQAVVPAFIRVALKRVNATEFLALSPAQSPAPRACPPAGTTPARPIPSPSDPKENSVTASAPTSDLTGWRSAPFTGAGITHDVYEKGTGPGVVLLPEIPG